jgi:hypothetical protein
LGWGKSCRPTSDEIWALRPAAYDSVELTSSLAWFDPLYEMPARTEPRPPGEAGRVVSLHPPDRPSSSARTSRRDVSWAAVIRARDRLRDSGVGAIVAAVPPPNAAFDRVARLGTVGSLA